MGLILTVFINTFGIFAWYYFSIFCHEHGHFFAAKLVGFHPYHLKVGSYKSITQKWIFGSTIELGSYPGGGLTFASLSNITWANLKTLKLRLSVFLIGGSLVNLVLFWGLLIVFRSRPSVLLFVLCLIEFGLVFYSLFPMEIMIAGNQHPNDGKILQSIFSQDYKQYYKNAFIAYQNEISKYGALPENRLLFGGEINRLQMLIDAQLAITYSQYHEAARLLEELLRLGNLAKSETAYILDTLLSIVINHGQMQYLAQADLWSKRLVQVLGHFKTVQGTRGAILAELGRYAEAKDLLLPLTEPGNEAIDFTIGCWYLAKVDYYLGNSDKVQYWLNQAEQFGSDSPYISSIFARLSQEIKGNK